MYKPLLILLIIIGSEIIGQVKQVNIDWTSIKNSDGKLKLNLIKTWGADLKSKEEYFGGPYDVAIDQKGNYYFVCLNEN